MSCCRVVLSLLPRLTRLTGLILATVVTVVTVVTETLIDLVKKHAARQSCQEPNRSPTPWPDFGRPADSPDKPLVPSGGYTPGLRGRIRLNGIFQVS